MPLSLLCLTLVQKRSTVLLNKLKLSALTASSLYPSYFSQTHHPIHHHPEKPAVLTMLPSQVQNHHSTSEPLINLPVPMIIMFHVYSRSIRTRTAKSSILLCCRYYGFGGGGEGGGKGSQMEWRRRSWRGKYEIAACYGWMFELVWWTEGAFPIWTLLMTIQQDRELRSNGLSSRLLI